MKMLVKGSEYRKNQKKKIILAMNYKILYIGNMKARKGQRLKELVCHWPWGAVYTQIYLTEAGYSADLVKSYRKAGWIEWVGTGAFSRCGDTVDWMGGLYAIQKQLEVRVHAGGRTALELQGYAHYGRMSGDVANLFGSHTVRLPKWFKVHDWGVKLNYKRTIFLPYDLEESFTEYHHRGFKIRISSLERAIIEVVYLTPSDHGFDEAQKLMDMLTTLRPAVVQALLERCDSVRTKRLFLYMAEKAGHAWFRCLNTEAINLGSGNRMLVKGGKLNRKYMISVPQG